MRVTLLDELTELRRELEAREQRYPYLIHIGFLTQMEADWRQACMAAAIARLETWQGQAAS